MLMISYGDSHRKVNLPKRSNTHIGLPGVFINNPMITITIRISSPGLIFNPTIIDYRLDHAAITDYD